jgi:type I restriction-modification system DNA methylase subunit
VLEDGLAGLEDGIAQAIENGDVFARAAAQDLVPLVQQAKILAMKFDAVVANPYMGRIEWASSNSGSLRHVYREGRRIIEGDWLQQHGYDARLDVFVLVR